MMINCKVGVLQIALGTGMLGGVSRFLLNYYGELNHTEIHFDFLFCHKNSFGNENNNPIIADSDVKCLDCLDNIHNSIRNYIELIRKLELFLKTNHYDVIHINSGSIPLQAACIYAIRKTSDHQHIISHSHSAGKTYNRNGIHIWKSYIYNCLKLYIRKQASYCFACSTEAAIALFGHKVLSKKKFRIIHNAIDCKHYRYNMEVRKKIRTQMGATENTLVIGHVGRFDKVKNHTYLLDIFCEVHRKKPDSMLWIVGDGDERKKIEEKVKILQINDSVILTGERDDVAEILQGMDCFVLPSFFEGLSLVAIEAQAAGLKVFLSDKVSREHSITNLTTYLSIDESPNLWAEEICNNNYVDLRCDKYNEVKEAGYDIKSAASKLESFYLELIR